MNEKVLKTLFDDGAMTALYKAGFIGAKAFTYRDIYLWVDAQIQTRKISKNQAVMEATEKFNRCESVIWTALKTFK